MSTCPHVGSMGIHEYGPDCKCIYCSTPCSKGGRYCEACCTDHACCETMTAQLHYDCGEHGTDCADVVVREAADGTRSLFAANAQYECNFCPWCGTKQPEVPA